MDDFETARNDARAHAKKLIEKYREEYRLDTARWSLEHADAGFLARITQSRISGRALLSNEHVHLRAQYAVIDAAIDAYRRHPERQWLSITVAWDRGITWEREPFVDTMSLRRIVYGHLDSVGLDGFGGLEFDTWTNFTGEPGRRIVGHCHFLGYPADGARVKVRALGKSLSARRALPNTLSDDVDSVVIKNVGKSPADFANFGGYIFKRPAYAKMYVPEREHNDETTKSVGHRRGSVVRLTEIQSHLEVGDVLFSIGGGREIAAQVRKKVAHEVRERRDATPAPSRDEVIRHWRRIRLTNGSQHFREPIIITCKEDRARERK